MKRILKKIKDFIGTIFYWIIFRILNDIERRLKRMSNKDNLNTYEIMMKSGERKIVVSTDKVIERMKNIGQIKHSQFAHVASEADKSSLLHFTQVMEDN